jgi:hypothetical protein
MPLVSPLHELILFIAIPFLDFADKLVVVPLDLLQVIIGKLAPLLFEFTFELRPFSFELISVHWVSLLYVWQISLPHLGFDFRSPRAGILRVFTVRHCPVPFGLSERKIPCVNGGIQRNTE